ncbi:MAG: thiamine pyrophosphate-dependent dehydrogenase E1 component subunit alpha [Candidatus Dormibacteria bacterium]
MSAKPAAAAGRAGTASAGTRPSEKLGRDDLLKMFRYMVLARTIDERMWILNRQGRVPFVMPGQGHEGGQVALGLAMRPGVDYFVPYYRSLALSLVWGMTPRDLMLGCFSRAEDPMTGGRMMLGHYGRGDLNYLTGSSCTGNHLPHAVGAALAARVRGTDQIAGTNFGEGAASEGDVHESMNFAAIHKLGVIFVCENNQYAISVGVDRQMAVPRWSDRAVGYGMPGFSVDGGDLLACYDVFCGAVERARSGEGPTAVEVRMVRLTAHSSDDSDKYRSREEVQGLKEKDPIDRFRRLLVERKLLSDADEESLRESVRQEVAEATDYAESRPVPDAGTLLDHLYG